MKISHEVPIDLLKTSREFNSYDYCLVHALDENARYREFYLNSAKQGRWILLDNSIFELQTAFDADKFAEWVVKLSPSEYIVPDALEDVEKTITQYQSFKQKYSDLKSNAIAVVQGKTYEEIVNCYKIFAADPWIKKIAISFDYSHYLNDNTYSVEVCDKIGINLNIIQNKWQAYMLGRIRLIARLKRDGILVDHKPLHLLGNAIPGEFSFYRSLGLNRIIHTIDTSNPIVAGILGKRYEGTLGLEEKWSVKLIDFIDTKLTAEQLKLCWYNVCKFRKMANG